MTGHLSETQLENYRLRQASEAEMAAAAEHLEACAECRGTLLRRRVGAMTASLAGVRPSHLTFEELESYVDGRAGAVERELVESHAGWCENCAGQLRTLERCAEVMRTAPAPGPELPSEYTRLMARASAPMQMAAPAPGMAASIAPPPPPPPKRRRWVWIVAAILVLLAALLIWILRR